jgi:hypothetical protein
MVGPAPVSVTVDPGSVRPVSGDPQPVDPQPVLRAEQVQQRETGMAPVTSVVADGVAALSGRH